MNGKFFKYSIIVFLLLLILVYTNGQLLDRYTKLDVINRMIDEVNPFVGKNAVNSLDIDEINLILSSNDISYSEKFIDNIKQEAKKTHVGRPMISNNSNIEYRKIKIYYNGKKYKGKARIHGTSPWHFVYPKKSYAVKLDKNNLIKNMRRFSLTNLEKPSISSIASYKISKLFGFMDVNSFLVKLKINDKLQGVYLLEEKLHKTLLEKNNLSNVDIIKPVDNYDHQYPNGNHEHPFVYDLSNTQIKKISKKNIGQTLRYKALYDNKLSVSNLKKLIDIKKFAKFDALRILFGDSHGVLGANQKILYDTSTGTMAPFFRTEGIVMPLRYNDYGSNFEKKVYNLIEYKKFKNNPLYKTLVKDDQYRILRNSYLNEIVKNKQKIIDIYDRVMEELIPILKVANGPNSSSRRLIYNEYRNYEHIKENLNIIEKYLNYSKVFVEAINVGNELEISISPDSNTGVFIDRIDANLLPNDEIFVQKDGDKGFNIKFKNIKSYLNEETFILGLDGDLDVVKNTFKFNLKSHKTITNFEIKFSNLTTGKAVEDKDILYVFVDRPLEFSFDYLKQNIDKFLDKYKELGLVVKNKDIYILKGSYKLDENLILPYGYNLIIEKGVNIGIGLNKSILVYGELHVKGTEVEPVIISNTDHNSFFGSVASIGNGETESVIEYLHIWGGSNANINGIHSSGALSLYNHNSVKILNSRIFNNSGDDGINIKNSTVLLDGNILDGNAADQLDIDASSGLIKNNQFFSKPLQSGYKLNQISIDDNGDGADFSGSNIRVKNNKFYGFLDKAISIGENTKAIVTGNNLFNNNSAIVAKDQSKVFIYKNIYKHNSIDVQMYRKKPFFNFPEVYDFNNNQSQVKNIKKTLGSKYYKLSNMNKKLDFNIESMNFLGVENIDWLEVGY